MEKRIALILVVAAAAGVFVLKNQSLPHVPFLSSEPSPEETHADGPQEFHFSQLLPKYRFSGELQRNWSIEFVPGSQAINIYNPESEGSSPLEQSQIFIRYFEASTFQTLSTVTVLKSEKVFIM